jgi:hypothetical protein
MKFETTRSNHYQQKSPPHPLNQLDGKMNTYMKVRFNIFDPHPEQVNILDIARGLAFKGHFSGQTPFLFSIAQHSVLTAALVAAEHPTNRELQLAALLHDAAEAYIGDMIKPVKVRIPDFEVVENRILAAIFVRYDLPIGLMKTVKAYDQEAQAQEFDVFYEGRRNPFIQKQTPDESMVAFYEKFLYLKGL